MAPGIFLWISIFPVLLAYCVVRYSQSPWRKLPPGPRGIPLLGNVFQLPKNKQWFKFLEWKDEYGPIMHLNMAGQPLIILNSLKVAADLLDRRAAIYSDRPRNIVASDIMTSGLFMVFCNHNDIWRRMRKAGHEALTKGVIKKYHPTQYTEAILLASGMMSTPKVWDAHLRRVAASTVMSVIYDHAPIQSTEEPSVQHINDFVARLTRAAMPGAHLVEFFPWMKHIPTKFAGWKRRALDAYRTDSAMFHGLFDGVDERIRRGEERPSLSATLIQEAGRHGLSHNENSWLAGSMYSAGAETTYGVLAWWMLAMVAYPEVQKLAQEELDRVVGRARPPNFDDFEQLPYLRAMVKEALRWRPVDPMGLPHRSSQDDWYDGYFIPAGSIMIANVWQMNRDPEIFGPDASHFNPARHLDKNGKIALAPADTHEESNVTYGFGRRICVGRHVANNSLFIYIALMLWAMRIERETDKDGNLLPLDVDGCIEDGLVVRPIPFTCKITPRFPEAPSMLEHTKEDLDLKSGYSA